MSTLTLPQIAKEKFLAEHPDARVATGLPRLDLRQFQTALLKRQRAFRHGALAERKMRAHERNRWRIRVRSELITPHTKPVDQRSDASGKNRYIELPNGQVVSFNRIVGLRGWSFGHSSFPTLRHNAARRRTYRHQSNPVLRAIAMATILPDLSTKEAA